MDLILLKLMPMQLFREGFCPILANLDDYF